MMEYEDHGKSLALISLRVEGQLNFDRNQATSSLVVRLRAERGAYILSAKLSGLTNEHG